MVTIGFMCVSELTTSRIPSLTLMENLVTLLVGDDFETAKNSFKTAKFEGRILSTALSLLVIDVLLLEKS